MRVASSRIPPELGLSGSRAAALTLPRNRRRCQTSVPEVGRSRDGKPIRIELSAGGHDRAVVPAAHKRVRQLRLAGPLGRGKIWRAMAETDGSTAPTSRVPAVQPEALAAATPGLADSGPRVLVLYEGGASGSRAICQARELMQAQHGMLTVATVAPVDTRVRGTGVSARDFNGAVRDSAQRELDDARRLLGSVADGIVFEVVFDGGDRSLAGWVADRAFDVVLLPARRRLISRRSHPVAATLRESTSADVRIVSA